MAVCPVGDRGHADCSGVVAMVSRKQARARAKFKRMVKVRARKMRLAKIKRLKKELAKLRRRR